MNIKEYLDNHDIPTAGTENEHVSPGWTGIDCPFCGEYNQYHMGISDTGGVKCWRCGGHKLTETLKMLKIPLKDFFSKVSFGEHVPGQEEENLLEEAELPPGTRKELLKHHRNFLREKSFDPDEIVREWSIMGIGPGGGRYSHRVLCPVYENGVLVSWTARTLGGSDTAYRSAPKTFEAKNIKKCLYGYDKAREFSNVIVVEGPTDARRMGPGAVATFGTAWTAAQVKLLTRWEHVFVLYDMDDTAAQSNADLLVYLLLTLGTEADALVPEGSEAGDPGELSPEEVEDIRREAGIALL